MVLDDQALRRISVLLERMYGKKELDPSGTLLDELVRTILSQATNDTSAARAFASLKAAFPTWDVVRDSPVDEVAAAIAGGGLSKQRAAAIRRILEQVTSADGRISLDFLREMEPAQAYAVLRRFGGVGPKTAACVLLFGLGLPFFPVDTHILRIFRRLGLARETWGAAKLQEAIQRVIPPEIVLSLHLNLITHGQRVCRAKEPRCGQCVLRELCRRGAGSGPA